MQELHETKDHKVPTSHTPSMAERTYTRIVRIAWLTCTVSHLALIAGGQR